MEKLILRMLLEHIEEGIHVVDRFGNTVIYNESMAKIEGLEPEEVIGKNIRDLFPYLHDANSTLTQAMETGTSQTMDLQDYTNLRGERISAMNTSYPLISDDGQILGAMEISKDISHLVELSKNVNKLPSTNKKDYKPNYYTFDFIIGKSHALEEAINMAKKCARSDATVLIYGATGTGKELFAQSIHNASRRKDGPFVPVNCGAIPGNLLESLLFGTVRGAYTGSIDSKGLFEQADGGTLFLDEINSMSLELQSKLLRVLQESSIRKVGGEKDLYVNVRVIAATNESPLKQVKDGTLRKDFFYRLNVLSLYLPELRERVGDIELLSQYFLMQHKDENSPLVGLTPALLKSLKQHRFPGNVRELEHLIEAAVHLKEDDGQYLDIQDMPNSYFYQDLEEPLYYHQEGKPLGTYLDNLEENLIALAFAKEAGNISLAAKRLGISRQNLQYKLKKYKIE